MTNPLSDHRFADGCFGPCQRLLFLLLSFLRRPARVGRPLELGLLGSSGSGSSRALAARRHRFLASGGTRAILGSGARAFVALVAPDLAAGTRAQRKERSLFRVLPPGDGHDGRLVGSPTLFGRPRRRPGYTRQALSLPLPRAALEIAALRANHSHALRPGWVLIGLGPTDG